MRKLHAVQQAVEAVRGGGLHLAAAVLLLSTAVGALPAQGSAVMQPVGIAIAPEAPPPDQPLPFLSERKDHRVTGAVIGAGLGVAFQIISHQMQKQYGNSLDQQPDTSVFFVVGSVAFSAGPGALIGSLFH